MSSAYVWSMPYPLYSGAGEHELINIFLPAEPTHDTILRFTLPSEVELKVVFPFVLILIFVKYLTKLRS